MILPVTLEGWAGGSCVMFAPGCSNCLKSPHEECTRHRATVCGNGGCVHNKDTSAPLHTYMCLHTTHSTMHRVTAVEIRISIEFSPSVEEFSLPDFISVSLKSWFIDFGCYKLCWCSYVNLIIIHSLNHFMAVYFEILRTGSP